MIIVSQDKNTILNFNDVTKIYINTPLENNDGEFEIMAENEWITEIIGYYKTEAMAKEVLREIVSYYKQWNKDANNAVTIIPKVYYMPEV